MLCCWVFFQCGGRLAGGHYLACKRNRKRPAWPCLKGVVKCLKESTWVFPCLYTYSKKRPVEKRGGGKTLLVKIFTSALGWNAVNRPKRRDRRNVFSSIFGSSINVINMGWGSVSWKGRNPLAQKIKSSFETFLFWWLCLPPSQRTCIFKHHLCGQYAKTISLCLWTGKSNLFHIDYSH